MTSTLAELFTELVEIEETATTLERSPSLTLSDSSDTPISGEWQSSGLCGHCLMPIQSAARGTKVRHAGSLVPYGDCDAAQRFPRPVKFGADICEMRPVNLELIAKLDHYGIDPRDHKHWRYVRETTGGGHRVFDPKYPGEQ